MKANADAAYLRKCGRMLQMRFQTHCKRGHSLADARKSLKEQIVGTWSLVSVDIVEANGTRSPLYSPNPKGIVVFESGGHYVLQLTNPTGPICGQQ